MPIQKVTIFISIEGYIYIYILAHAYYGEYPLAFAAAFGYKEIYDYLIDHGADPNMQDTYGNTVLHMLVIRDRSVG
jgi:ankyrin repeat protein